MSVGASTHPTETIFIEGIKSGRDLRDRIAVGRRGQGQDRRSADRTARHRRPLPGRGQRRPYRRPRRTNLQALAGAQRHLPPRGAMRHRRRRGAQSGQPVGRNRRPGRPRRQGRREPDDQRPGACDLPLARRGRPAARRAVHQRRGDRHHDARHRAVLPRQGRPLAGRPAGRHVPARVSSSGSSRSPR